jgi:hypothetical protein
MKPLAPILVAASLAATATKAVPPFVAGNDAVRITASGRTVLTPPAPPSVGKPCAARAACHAGAWHMVETASGLAECTEPFARATTCRASTYGRQKLPRLWVVRKGAAWLWCQKPDVKSQCVDMAARPPANLIVALVQ